MLWERWMVATQRMLMFFSAFFCMFTLFLNKTKRKKLQQNLPTSTETVSDLSKYEQEV